LGARPGPVEAFVEEAAGALAFLEEATPLETRASMPFSYYFADQPGGKERGRSLDVVPFAAREGARRALTEAQGQRPFPAAHPG